MFVRPAIQPKRPQTLSRLEQVTSGLLDRGLVHIEQKGVDSRTFDVCEMLGDRAAPVDRGTVHNSMQECLRRHRPVSADKGGAQEIITIKDLDQLQYTVQQLSGQILNAGHAFG